MPRPLYSAAAPTKYVTSMTSKNQPDAQTVACRCMHLHALQYELMSINTLPKPSSRISIMHVVTLTGLISRVPKRNHFGTKELSDSGRELCEVPTELPLRKTVTPQASPCNRFSGLVPCEPRHNPQLRKSPIQRYHPDYTCQSSEQATAHVIFGRCIRVCSFYRCPP